MKAVFSVLFLSVCLLINFNCSKDDESMEPDEASCTDGIKNGDETGVDCGGSCGLCGPPTGGYYFYGIIGGEEVIVKGNNGTGSGLVSCGAFENLHDNGGSWHLDINNLSKANASVQLTKGFSSNTPPDDTDYYNMFAEGSYPYKNSTTYCDDLSTMAVVYWTDDSDNVWYSGSGSQTGSSFKITSRGPSDGISTIIEGEFSCKLYFGSEVKTVESGKFRFVLGLF